MPKVYLTQADRERAAIKAERLRISDGLAVTKNRQHLTNADIAEILEISRNSVAHLFAGDKVMLDFDTILKVIKLSGYKLERISQQ